MKKLFLIVLSVLLVFTGCNNNTSTPTITDITLDYTNVKTSTTLAEAASWTEAGLVVKATYSDGSTNTLSPSDYTVDKSEVTGATTSGEKTVSVTASGITKSFKINVTKSVASITVDTTGVNLTPTRLTAKNWATTGLKVNVTYSDETTETLESGFEVDAKAVTGATEVGSYSVTVTFGGKAASFIVTVSEEVLASLQVEANSLSLTVDQAKAWTTDALTVTAIYESEERENIPVSSCTVTGVEGITQGKDGSYSITVEYGGKNATITMYVVKKPSSFEVDTSGLTSPTRLTASSWEPVGLKLNVTYDDGSTAVVTEGFTVDASKVKAATAAGSYQATVEYVGMSKTFDVTVEEEVLQGISVDSSSLNYPSRLTAKNWKADGIVVTANYANGKSEQIASTATGLSVDISNVTSATAAGTYTVTVSYTLNNVSRSTSFSAIVKEEVLSSITLDTSALNLNPSLSEAASWSVSGLIVKADYESDESENLTGYTTAGVESVHSGKIGDTCTITVTYGGKSATFSVAVGNDIDYLSRYFEAFPYVPSSASEKMNITQSAIGAFTNASYTNYDYTTGNTITKTITSNGDVTYYAEMEQTSSTAATGSASLDGTFSITASGTTTRYVAQSVKFDIFTSDGSTTEIRSFSGTLTKNGSSIAGNTTEIVSLLSEITMAFMSLPEGSEGVTYKQAPSDIQTGTFTMTSVPSTVAGFEDLSISGTLNIVSPMSYTGTSTQTSDADLKITTAAGQTSAIILKGTKSYPSGSYSNVVYTIDSLSLDGKAIDTATISTTSALYRALCNWIY